jgi:hypothetical protein
MKLLLPLSTAWSSRAVKRMKGENAIQTPYIRIKGSRPPAIASSFHLVSSSKMSRPTSLLPSSDSHFAWAEAFPIKASDYTAK